MGHGAGLPGDRDGGCARSEVIQVQVHAQLAADETVVIDVRAEGIRGLVAVAVFHPGRQLVRQRAVLIEFVVGFRHIVHRQRTAPFDLAADEVVVGNLPVDAGVAVEVVLVCGGPQRALFLELEVFAEGVLHEIALLAEGEVGIVDAGEEVHAAGAVVDVQIGGRIVVLLPVERLGVGGVEVEAEAFALALDGLDADHGAHGGVVLGAGVGDDLDALDLVALQAVELAGVRDLVAVDVHQRSALADDLQAVLAFDEARGLGQHVLGGAGVLQHGAADVGLQAFAGEFGLGHDGRDGCAFQQGSVLDECNHGAVHRGEVDRLVAQDGYHHDAVGLVCNYIEGAVFGGDGAADHGGVGLGEHGHVGVLDRLALFVHHLAFPICFTLCAGAQSRQNHHRCYNNFLHCLVYYFISTLQR